MSNTLSKRYTEPDAILNAASTGDVTLLSLSWLLEFEETGQCLPRRQELPAEAFLSGESFRTIHAAAPTHVQVAALPIIAISYCWLDAAHPDADGEQLRLVASVLRAEAERGYNDFYEDMGVFWDWASLYQRDAHSGERSPSEAQSFTRALTETMA